MLRHPHPLTVLAAVAVLAGCGSSTSTATTATAPPTSTVAPTTATTTTPATTAVSTTTVTPTTVAPATTVTPTTVAPATTVAPTTVAPATTVAANVPVLAYLIRDEHLVAVRRTVTAATPLAAVQALLGGPTPAEAAAGIVTMIPSGTTVHGVTVAHGAATVDLGVAFAGGGGSLSMTGRVAELVFTVTQFPGITDVHVALDGVPTTSLSGEGLDVTDLTRATVEQWEQLVPLILLEQPADGDHVAQPIHVSGTSNSFEAVVNYQLLAPDRTVLVEGNLMATSGTGTWGTFDADLLALPAGTTGPVIVRVFEYSAMDGTPVNITEVTVTVS